MPPLSLASGAGDYNRGLCPQPPARVLVWLTLRFAPAPGVQTEPPVRTPDVCPVRKSLIRRPILS